MLHTRTEGASSARRGMIGRPLAVGCALVAVAVGGCTGSTKGPTPNSTGPTPVSTAGPTPVSTAVPTPVGTDVLRGGDGDAATEVTTSFLRFFDPTVAEAERLNLIQGGDAFSQAISLQQRSEFAKAVTVKVSTVTVNSADKATVIFTLLLDGQPAGPSRTGYAVRQDGMWKVAGTTYCSVLSTQGAPPPVCTTASATTLPG